MISWMMMIRVDFAGAAIGPAIISGAFPEGIGVNVKLV
jgi:hypothetical protein